MNLPQTQWFATTPRSRAHLVAVSGGADSVALLHLLVRYGFRKLVVCHLNHRLRGRAATADARFVARLAADLGLPCEVGHADVRALAPRHGASLELAARQARHAFLAACAAKHRCPRVLFAHHADDQAETILLNLLRGSAGLKGMREESTHLVAGRRLVFVRPLLEIRRTQLREWLAANGLPWREDRTNARPITARNRLRHEVMPLLESIAGRDPVPAITRAGRIARETAEAVELLLPALHVEDPQGMIHLPTLRALPQALQNAVLHDWLCRHGVPDISAKLLDAARDLTDPARPAAMVLPGGLRLRRRAARLWVER